MIKTNASIRGSYVSGNFIPLRPGELVASGLGMRFWDAYLSSIEFDATF